MMQSILRVSLSLWILTIGFLVQGVLPVAAQTTDPTQFGVTVSPITDEFSIKPGAVVTRTITVSNPINDLVTLYPVTLNFTTDNELGQPKFYTLAEMNSPYAISSWVTFDKPFIRLASGQVDQFTYTVTAPSTAEPGGHYGAILFSTTPPKVDTTQTQVAVVGLIGTLVLATVPGDLNEATTIKQFDAPTVLIKGPALFSMLFANSGNVHTKPQGEIKIRNWTGSLVTALKINDGAGNVLPGSSRRFDSQWNFDWKRFGKYTATATINYGSPAIELSATRTFIIVPIWLIVLLGLILLTLIYVTLIRPWLKRRAGRKPIDVSEPGATPETENPGLENHETNEVADRENINHNGKVLLLLTNQMLETIQNRIVDKGHLGSIAYLFQIYVTGYLTAGSAEERDGVLDALGKMVDGTAQYTEPSEQEAMKRTIETIKRGEAAEIPSLQSDIAPLVSDLRSYVQTIASLPEVHIPPLSKPQATDETKK